MDAQVFKCCNKCSQSKPLNDFARDSKNCDGRQYQCKACNAAYYRNNRAHIKKMDVAYRQANPEINKKRCTSYRQANREKMCEKDRSYRKANLEQVKKTQAKYREANKEQLRNSDASRYRERVRTVDGRADRLFQSAKSRAKKKHASFTLLREDVLQMLVVGKCQRSGIPFDLRTTRDASRNPFAPSLDRIDNNKGYDPDNVVCVCTMFNNGKGEHSELDFIAMCMAVANKHRNNPRAIVRLMELGVL